MPDTLEIVVSAYNKVPYFGQFTVKDLPNPYGTANELLIGPNPVDLDGSLHLMFELEYDQEVSFNIFNQLGQMIFSNKVDLDQGFYGPNYTDISIDLRKIGFTTGQYIINANYNGQTFTKTFFVP